MRICSAREQREGPETAAIAASRAASRSGPPRDSCITASPGRDQSCSPTRACHVYIEYAFSRSSQRIFAFLYTLIRITVDRPQLCGPPQARLPDRCRVSCRAEARPTSSNRADEPRLAARAPVRPRSTPRSGRARRRRRNRPRPPRATSAARGPCRRKRGSAPRTRSPHRCRWRSNRSAASRSR